MIRALNVKMLILNDEQKDIHPVGTFNEYVTYWYHIRTSLLYKRLSK